MTEQQPDPGATFRLDQADAANEQATRDQTIWDHQVEDALVSIAMKRAHAQRTVAVANVLEALAMTLYLAAALGSVLAVVLALRAVIGWFQ